MLVVSLAMLVVSLVKDPLSVCRLIGKGSSKCLQTHW